MLAKQRIQSVQHSSVDVKFDLQKSRFRPGFFLVYQKKFFLVNKNDLREMSRMVYGKYCFAIKFGLGGSLLTNRRFYCYNLDIMMKGEKGVFHGTRKERRRKENSIWTKEFCTKE